jgi:hypothetical protein
MVMTDGVKKFTTPITDNLPTASLSDCAALFFNPDPPTVTLSTASGQVRLDLPDTLILSATLINGSTPVLSTANGLDLFNNGCFTAVVSSPPGLRCLIGDPLVHSSLFAIDPQNRLLHITVHPFSTTAIAESVSSYSASAEFLLIDNTVYARGAADEKPTTVAFSPPAHAR